MRTAVVDTRSVWLVLALGSYWAWSFTFLHNSLGIAGGIPGVWTVNAGAHALLLLAVAAASLRLRTPRATPALLGTVGALASLGVGLELLAAASGEPAWAYGGSVLAGGSTAALALVLFPQLARVTERDGLFVLVSSAVAASPLISLVILALPAPLDRGTLLALPLLTAFCTHRGYAGPESQRPGSSPSPGPRPAFAKSASVLSLVACSFVFALCTSLFGGSAMSGEGPVSQTGVLAITFLVMAAALVLVAIKGGTRWPTLLVLVFMPTLAAGVLLVPFLIPESRFVSDVLVGTARNLFSVYLYTSLALIIARQGRPVFATGVVVGVGDLGHVAGSVLASMFMLATDHQMLLGCVAIAYAVFLCSLLLMYPRSQQADPNLAEKPADSDAALRQAASSAGLSEREGEVLALLVGARTLASIADELGISYNTAKTRAASSARSAWGRAASWPRGSRGSTPVGRSMAIHKTADTAFARTQALRHAAPPRAPRSNASRGRLKMSRHPRKGAGRLVRSVLSRVATPTPGGRRPRSWPPSARSPRPGTWPHRAR